ncbi:MAG: PEP-CTERM sorting domain-containing protein [Alteromonadaceae bacterium]|nr:PEP-CTERM sorting domain-containing protein [Alteromonadaceae bacterium]
MTIDSFYGPGPDVSAHQWREIAFNPILGETGSQAFTSDTVTVEELPEPSTLAIFALGIMGLRLRSSKKIES